MTTTIMIELETTIKDPRTDEDFKKQDGTPLDFRSVLFTVINSCDPSRMDRYKSYALITNILENDEVLIDKADRKVLIDLLKVSTNFSAVVVGPIIEALEDSDSSE